MQTQKQIKHNIVQKLIRKATPAELILRKALTKEGIHYIFQRAFRTRDKTRQVKGGGKDFTQISQLFVADFYLPRSATIIEIDGSAHNGRYNHDTKRQQILINDRKMVKYFLRFTNKDIYYKLDHVLTTIKKMRPVRFVSLPTGEYHIRHENNKEIARLNEIEFIIQSDHETNWKTKRNLIRNIA